MAALVQSLPSPSTSTMTMLQTRPSSSDAFQNSPSNQQHHRNPQMPMNVYNGPMAGMQAGAYRPNFGNAGSSAISHLNMQGTSMMHTGSNPLRQHPTGGQHPRYDARTASTPTLPTMQQMNASNTNRPRPSAGSSFVPLGNSAAYGPMQPSATGDGSSRSLATLDLNLSASQKSSYANVAKAAPDRYKRNHRRAETAGGLSSNPPQNNSSMPSGSGMGSVAHLYNHPVQSSSTPTLTTYPTYRGVPSPNAAFPPQAPPAHRRLSSQDDMIIQHRNATSDLAKRYKRRSISVSSWDQTAETVVPVVEAPQQVKPMTYAAMLAAPAPSQSKETRPSTKIERPAIEKRRDSSESGSVASSSAKSFSIKKGPEPSVNSSVPAQQGTAAAKSESKSPSVPARGSSEPSKRFTNPSPLSKPVTMNTDRPANNATSTATETPKPAPSAAPAYTGIPESPAAQQLAALNKKENKKEGKSSRLRRAFSFGSAAELRKASAENNANAAKERNKLQKPQFADEEEAQQAAIVQQQEASGLGESIYSGQGHFFTGSTDNLSISSTASSASVMIRKMGKGVKKGSRSLVGLFRPKSVVGVPAADSAVPEPTMAQVSMVTVEAEREKVNVNVNPHDQPGGGTGFPKLERNSIETTHLPGDSHSKASDEIQSRQSIVGGERERAEVLAAVKKGILKRTGTDSGNSSPQVRPVDGKGRPNFNLPQIPRVNDSPQSSNPATPVDEHTPKGHGNPDSVQIEGEYFLSIQNYANGSSTSIPTTPQGTLSKNISFSPRIIFHDTWPSGEYDRRGEIATCNRLTPLLAQQIKEELNSFKMEMEVHVESKVNTHFF